MLCFASFLMIVSFLHTTGMEIVKPGAGSDSVVTPLREGIESVAYYNDPFIINILLLAVCLLISFLIIPRLKKIPVTPAVIIMGVYTIVIGMIWVSSSKTLPTEDSFMVTEAAVGAAHDDFSLMADDRYFMDFSFQLGYVLFNEVAVRIHEIFGPYENALFFERINVVFLAVSYIGIALVNNKIFKDKRITVFTVLLFMILPQPVIFTVFTYGIIPGLAFAVFALYFEISFLKKSNPIFAALSAVFIAIAVMIKTNYVIFLIAMLAIAFATMFRRKKFLGNLAFIAAAAILGLSVTPAVKSFYESRIGKSLKEQIPFVSWISMGFSESDLAPGWYNAAYTVLNYSDNNFDPDRASEKSVENIKERLEYFSENRQYANDFFYKKIVSQWNETTYQSIWNNKVRYTDGEKGKIAKWVCGEGEYSVREYMDIVAQFVFVAVFLGLLCCLRNRDFLTTAFPLIILGGFLYHLISEAKSQYAMPYFIIMCGFAPYGAVKLCDLFRKKISGRKFLSKVFAGSCEDPGIAAADEETEGTVGETAYDDNDDRQEGDDGTAGNKTPRDD